MRGGGDIATGTIYRLHRCGYKVLILESGQPTAIRRRVAFCEAIYDSETRVEQVTCKKIDQIDECEEVWREGNIPILVDEKAEVIRMLKPDAVIDGILAKKNLGTSRDMAPLTIALGPGFAAGKDVDFVVETMRGHNLGRIIEEGTAMANTGIPGLIGGYGKERVIHAPASGRIRLLADIGDVVKKGQVIAKIGEVPVYATLDGILRGIIREGFPVWEHLKIADIDPRMEQKSNCDSISDKARCIAGSVLEILVSWERHKV